LSTYLNCPLDFYFKYILGLRESDELEEEMGADVLGNIIHKVLEELYLPYVGAAPNFDHIESTMNDCLDEIISKEMKNRWIRTGINKMNIQIIQTLLKKFIELDKSFIQGVLKKGGSFKIVTLEERLSRQVYLDIEGEELEINFRGFADRIDQVNDELRIIDYKTGKVDGLNKVEVQKIFQDQGRSKALQLLMYRAMYDNFEMPNVKVGIIGFRNINDYLQSVSILKKEQNDVKENFYSGFRGLLYEMLFGEEEIKHNPKSTWCKFCEVH